MSTEDNLPLEGTIETLSLVDTVYTWYNTTNEIIELVNPLNIYDVIPGNGLTSIRSGISNGFMDLSVLLKSTGGLAFEENGSISLSTSGLETETFSSSSSYKLFAEDSSGEIKAISFDLNPGEGIQFGDNTNSLTIGIDETVVTLTKIQTLTNKTLTAPKISAGSATVTITAPSISTSYSLTLPTTDGAFGQYLQTDGNGILSWATPTAGSKANLDYGAEGGVTSAVTLGVETFQILGGVGIDTSIPARAQLQISVDSTVIRTTPVQTMTNKSLVSPRLLNSTSSASGISLISPSGLSSSYSITLPITIGSVGQALKIQSISGGNNLIMEWGTAGGGGGATTLTIAGNTGSDDIILGTNTLTFTGVPGESIFPVTTNSIICTVTDNTVSYKLNTGIFEAGRNMEINYDNNKVTYILPEIIENVTLFEGLFKGIQYLPGSIDEETETGPLYVLVDSSWDETNTNNYHLSGQLVLVPLPTT
jgi:hypothetical protein